jgi:hypothetical protein
MVGLRFGGRGVSNFEIVRAGAFMWARGAQHNCSLRGKAHMEETDRLLYSSQRRQKRI